MKIKCTTDGYSGPVGTFTGGQVRDVTSEIGNYLLKSFPNWFEVVESDQEPTKRNMQPESNTAMTAKSKRGGGRK